MTAKFMKLLREHLQRPVFTEQDLKSIFSQSSPSQIYNSLSYHRKQGHLFKLKRGVYSLSSLKDFPEFNKFHMANILYPNSYVSFESALSHYTLIPEAVYETTSACYLPKKKTFKTRWGYLSYSYSPVDPFYSEVEYDQEYGYRIATPIRALFDLIYRRKIIYENIDGLDLDLRIDLEDLGHYLKDYSARDIIEFGEKYKKQSTRVMANLLVGYYK